MFAGANAEEERRPAPFGMTHGVELGFLGSILETWGMHARNVGANGAQHLDDAHEAADDVIDTIKDRFPACDKARHD